MISLLDLFFHNDHDKVIIRKTIISFLSLKDVTCFISLNNLTLNIINVIGDDDDIIDQYKFYPNKLVLTSRLCDHICSSRFNERRHFNQIDFPLERRLLDLCLPRLKSIESKSYVLIKRSILLKLLDVFDEEEQLNEIIITRMNSNALVVFSGLFIHRVGFGLRSLTLGSYGFVSAMPISDYHINQILCFTPNLTELKLMKLSLLSSHSIRSISNTTKLEKLEIVSCANMRIDKNSVLQFKLLLDKLHHLTYIDIRYSIECCNGILKALCEKAEVNFKSSSLMDDRTQLQLFNLKVFLSSRTTRQHPDSLLGLDANIWETFKDTFSSADILFIDFIRDESSSRSKQHFFLHNHDDASLFLYDIPLVLNKQTSFAVKQSIMHTPSDKFKEALSRKTSTPIKHNYAMDNMCLTFEHVGIDTHRKDTFIKLKMPPTTTTTTTSTMSTTTTAFTMTDGDEQCFNLKTCYGK